MTVSSLWKTLNTAGCGKRVGEKELVTGQTKEDLAHINPWNYNQQQTQTSKRRQTLAVDLSIWICESLTSQSMSEHNANPALHLVFSRTVKLLNLGVKLIFVVEGKSRVRTEMGDDDRFRKRRSGTRFWKACQDCQQLLELLGVTVVRAKAEGEALCALLSQRGIVDGVISNDGDCLLFGAKTIYTKYSNENMDNGSIIRYDLEDLRAVVEHADDEDDESRVPEQRVSHAQQEEQQVKFSRQDLVVFALLTGSDIVGSGLAKVGHKKAIRFIRKCKSDNPLNVESAALDEMKSWARAARAGRVEMHAIGDQIQQQETEENCDGAQNAGTKKKKKESCCSRCCHAGSKRNHRKHGCEICGTAPGESCFKVTSDDRFRKSLRAKALSLAPKFEPSKVLTAYMSPNENQIPLRLSSLSTSGIPAPVPQFNRLMQMNLIVKGRSLGTSRPYVQQAVGRLLARAELLAPASGETQTTHIRQQRDRPVPKLIQKSLIQKGINCYEVLWFVNASVTDENGEGIDGYEYATVETCELIHRRFPELVVTFTEAELERTKQGDGEKMRRQEFLSSFLVGQHQEQTESQEPENGNKKRKKKKKKRKTDLAREGFFVNKTGWRPKASPNVAPKTQRNSEDIAHLLRFVPKRQKQTVLLPTSPVRTTRKKPRLESDEISSLNDGSANELVRTAGDFGYTPKLPPCKARRGRCEPNLPPLTPSKELFCTMGEQVIPLTPLFPYRDVFPPPHIFVFDK